MLLTSFRIALKALNRNKLRTALTMLGMTIGVAAVIAMVALGSGAQETVSDDLQSAGTTLITVRAGNYTRGGEESNIGAGMGSANTLTADDADIVGKIEGVKYYSSGVRLRGWTSAGSERDYAQVLGTDVSFPKIYGWSLSKGKYFSRSDVASGATVAVLGQSVRDRLFGVGVNPDGKEIVIHNQTFRVIGLSSTTDDDQMESIFVPYTTLQKVLGIQNIHTITLFATHAGETTRISEEIRTVLRKRHHLDSEAVLARMRQTGLGGDQMPRAGAAVSWHPTTLPSRPKRPRP